MHEGDAVAFYTIMDSNGVCSSKISPIYVFNNGRFPQVQFGDADCSVRSYVDATTAATVYLCFNSKFSGTSSILCTLMLVAFYNVTAYNIAQETYTEHESEISDVYPPLNNSVMFPTESLTINITSKGNYVYAFKVGGLVAVNEIFPVYMYNRFYASTSAMLTALSTNKFLVPFSGWQPGREYELSVYSQTFASGTHVLFGSDLATGNRPYRYRFRVYDFSVETVGAVLSTATAVTISGTNFSSYTPELLIGGYQLEYVTTGMNLSFALNGSDCGDTAPTGNISAYTQTAISVTNLDLHGCTEGTLLLTLNITRECNCVSPSGCACSDVSLTKRADELSFFYKGGNLLRFQLGYLGCDKTCLTCSGSSNASCMSCNSASTIPYLANSYCVSACPTSLPIIYNTTVMYKGSSVLSMTCIAECPTGSYELVSSSGLIKKVVCTSCDSSCMYCTGPTMSQCTKCYAGKYLLDGVCVDECPTGEFDSDNNCVKYTMDATDAIYINAVGAVSGYVTGQEDVYLKLVKNTGAIAFTSIVWNLISSESSVATSEQLFANDTSVNTTTATVRKEYIASMSVGDTVVISATAKAYNISNSSITGVASASAVLTRKSPIIVGVTAVSPAAGMVQDTTFIIVLTNWTVENSTTVQVWVTYDVPTMVFQRSVDASNPILLTGVRFPTWGAVSETTKKTFKISVVASKLSESVTGSTVVTLINNYTSATVSTQLQSLSASSLTTDTSAIQAAAVVSAVASNSTNSDSGCSSEADCNYHGECSQAGGLRECACDQGWAGDSCGYVASQFVAAESVSAKLASYLKSQFLSSSTTTSPSTLSSLTAIVASLGQTPELLSDVDNLATYLQQAEAGLSWQNVSSMGADGVGSFVQAALSVLTVQNGKFASYLAGNSSINTSATTADEYYARANMSAQFKSTKSAIYSILDKASVGLAPKNSIITSGSDFEATVKVFYTNSIINSSSAAYFETSSSSASVTVPLSVFTSGPAELLANNTASIRLMRWDGNPYTYAKSAKLVRSDVVSFSFLNGSGGEMSVTGLVEPITVRLNVPGDLAGRTDLLCVFFDENAEETVTYQEYEDINVSALNLTDAEKVRQYPEWKASLYKSSPLIVRRLVSHSVTKKIGDFSTSGCQLSDVTGTVVSCKCTHMSDFAVKINVSDTATGPTLVAIPYVPPGLVKQVHSFTSHTII